MAGRGWRAGIRALREDPAAAHIAPLAAFLLLLLLTQEPVLIDNTLQPWYRHAPEQWVYPLQCLVAGALLWFFRRAYVLTPLRGWGFATVCALVGIGLWIAPSEFYRAWRMEPGGLLHFLGFQDRSEGGFDPRFFRDHSLLYCGAIALRLFRMIVIVPFIEEIFWRGFLMRFLYDRNRDFHRVPFGSFSWFSLVGTSLAFMLAHQPADYAAAFLYGLLAGWVAIRTRSLAACIWMHAVANLVLGVYVLWTGQRGFW
ncbi:MAG TPA: CAAX prenyl protease-related protein [Verrucomicrobiales bacterium]|nr:CAAX prenyl protease-related protein [Verrucomicrobiales bacterium]